MALIWLQITFYFLASSVKSEQQQHQQKANVPVVKSKKRQAMTPADDFQDSDPEDDYGDKSYVILLTFHSCTVGQYHISGSISSGPLSHFSDVNMALSWLIQLCSGISFKENLTCSLGFEDILLNRM